jgi:hypothetical protein
MSKRKKALSDATAPEAKTEACRYCGSTQWSAKDAEGNAHPTPCWKQGFRHAAR